MVALLVIFKSQGTIQHNACQQMNQLILILRSSPFTIDEGTCPNLFIFVGYLTMFPTANLHIVE
jgi:hypothetical protein